jgi:hypothetical protein
VVTDSSVNLSVAEERSVRNEEEYPMRRVLYIIRALGAGGDCRNADGFFIGDRLIP